MHEPNPKKLIAAFLILATLMSSSAFALSGYLTTKANRLEVSPIASLKSAFSKGKARNLNEDRDTSRKNLTEDLAASIAREILKSNQSVPQTELNDGILYFPENLNNQLDAYVSGVHITNEVFSIDESRIKIKKNASSDDVQKYFEFLKPILEDMKSGSQNLEKRVSGSQDANLVGVINLLYSQTQQKILAVETPEATLNFHRSLLRVLNVPVKEFDESVLREDPIKALAQLVAGQKIFEDRVAELMKELNLLQIEFKNISFISESKRGWIETVNAAGVPVLDWINWIISELNYYSNLFVQKLEYGKWYERILLMQIRDRLLKQITDAILNWAGSGIVKNVDEYYQKAYAAAAYEELIEYAKGFCTHNRRELIESLKRSTGAKSPFGYLEGDLTTDIEDLGFAMDCPLEDITEGYMNEFLSDDPVSRSLIDSELDTRFWEAYGSLILPSSNPYGQKIEAESKIIAAALTRARIATELVTGDGGELSIPDETCENGTSPRFGVCNDRSKPILNTPGKIKSALIGDALTSPLRRIETAEPSDWSVLLNAFINSALNKLLASNNKGVRSGEVTGSAKGDPYASCSGFTTGSENYLNCVNNINRLQNPPGSDQQGIRNTLISETKDAITKSSDTLDTILTSISTVSSTIAVLANVVTNCSTDASNAQTEIEILNQNFATLAAKADDITSRISFLESLLEEVEAHEPKDDTDYFTEKYSELQAYASNTYLSQEEANARINLSNFKDKLESAISLLSKCTTQ